MVDTQQDICHAPPSMDVLRKELTRINKRHQAKLLGHLEGKRIITPELRDDIVRSFGFLREDTMTALYVTRTEVGDGRQEDFHTDTQPCD